MAVPIHISISGDAAAKLRAEAVRRGIRPQLLGAAVITQAARDDMFEGILDGDSPGRIVNGKGHLHEGLTLLRCGVLYILGAHADADDVCRLSCNAIAILLDSLSSGPVSQALSVLEKRGLIERAGEASQSRVQPWRLLPAGRSLAAKLAGIGFAKGRT